MPRGLIPAVACTSLLSKTVVGLGVGEVSDARVDMARLRRRMYVCMFRFRAYFEVPVINMSVSLAPDHGPKNAMFRCDAEFKALECPPSSLRQTAVLFGFPVLAKSVRFESQRRDALGL